MRDDEKMFNIGFAMSMGMVFLIVFLQVCYRVQNSNLVSVRRSLEETKYEIDKDGTKLSALVSADSLRAAVKQSNPRAEVVSFSKTVHIDDIPMVE